MQHTWTPALSKRRAVMFLGDMWRYSGAPSGVGEKSSPEDGAIDAQLPDYCAETDAVSPIWRPSSRHYNIVLDAVGRDSASSIDELVFLHRNMQTHGIREDTVTFNTLLNACRLRRAWDYFREIEAQIRKRDEWGGIQPTSELWSAIVNVYAARDMVPQMVASRQIMLGFGLAMTLYTFGPIFAALRRFRRALARDRQDAWPAIRLALEEFDAMRHSRVAPNATILTNLALTVGLGNRYADPTHVRNGHDERIRAKLRDVGGEIASQLESMLSRARDPNVYVALLNLGGKSGALDDVLAVWQSLVTEAQFAHAAGAQQLMTSLTLAAYMNALIGCKQYREAISAFQTHALLLPAVGQHAKARLDVSKPRVQTVERPVYDAAIRAFARADQHRMCVRVLRTMVDKGIQPTALSVRYALLPPDFDALKRTTQRYTRRWTLPIATARDIWAMLLDSRQKEWARGPLPEPVNVAALPDPRLPVIVNDIASQFIRIAAYARNIGFGEQVFEALRAEAAHYRMGHRRHSRDGEDDSEGMHADDGVDASGAEARAGPGVDGEAGTAGAVPELHQCAPNVYTYTSMITLYGNGIDLGGVGKVWTKMLDDGIEPSIHTYTALISALHKTALRKRWRRSRERAEKASGRTSDQDRDMSGLGSDVEAAFETGGRRSMGDSATRALLTSQDETVWRVEDWLMSAAAGKDASGSEATSGEARLDLDIPLSTLLLRYHSMRITDIVNAARTDQASQDDKGAVEDIERVMRVCQAVEENGLRPDRRFHAALADFFDTCGDPTGARLVRERMDALDKTGQPAS
ncbi:hypothetical protein LPJ61_001833 [Coemansia biformis]|uniref:Pentacotripeptide-repeat region of PRORP domain-containing protein n=1 Tax=Coemansia biformis TaxID=1286918 RepID=A0A9W7Y9C2_9FUNG|nr:hypothetical protein LPJ61_001833 [Coemansia biformis]